MAYDEKLADRIRQAVGPRPEVTEKKMFGGLAFLHDGKMFVGIVKDDLMVRVGPERYDAALTEAHVRPMDFTGKPLKGMVYVAPAGQRGVALRNWVEKAVGHARSLPPKGG